MTGVQTCALPISPYISKSTRLIHTYDLCKSDCYFGTQLILIYMVKFSWVYTPLISALKIFGFICYQIFSYGFDLGNLCCMWSLFHFCEKKKFFLFLSSKLYYMIFSSLWSHRSFLEYFGSDLVFFWRKVYMGLL